MEYKVRIKEKGGEGGGGVGGGGESKTKDYLSYLPKSPSLNGTSSQLGE